MSPSPPGSSLFPYTTLFRSREVGAAGVGAAAGRGTKDGSHWPNDDRPGQRVQSSLFGHRKADGSGLVAPPSGGSGSEEHTSELQSPCNLVCRLLLEKKNITT